MGCLNSDQGFSHWFGNIHLSGPCNRSCYFCIGQHMQSLESLNVLPTWPLPGLDKFLHTCRAHKVSEVNITGTNTDPLMYHYLPDLIRELQEWGMRVGLRTNGATNLSWLGLVDKASVSIHSFNPTIYRNIMGRGYPPDLSDILKRCPNLKLNVVLCPENAGMDLLQTIHHASEVGIRKINLREPYGQPHRGDPLPEFGWHSTGTRYGMPVYQYATTEVMYWDVHFVEVESVNLYANGNVSETYPITQGYDPMEGKVLDQSNWTEAKRHLPQWKYNGS
jgi:hypothetical protein